MPDDMKPKWSWEINFGHVAQLVLVAIGFIGVLGGQRQEMKEFRGWLIRHDAIIDQQTAALAKLALTDAASTQDRLHLRELINEVKEGQDKILDYIRK